MSFHVGQHVVWVAGKPYENWPKWAIDYLRKGRVYVVAGVHPSELSFIDNDFLSFVDSPINPTIGRPQQFDARGFRPLDESRLDQLRAHLAPTPKQPVPA